METTEAPQRMRIYAQREADGEIGDIFLLRDGEALRLLIGEAELPLPHDALPAIFRRYGRPLEPDLDLKSLLIVGEEEGPLAIGDATLRRFRFMPFGWVHPADYLLWELPSQEPLAAPAPLVVSALDALGRALQKKSSE